MEFLRKIFDNAHHKLNSSEKTKKFFPLIDAFDTLMFTPNHVTKKPSWTVWPFLIANINSTNNPAPYDTTTNGKTTKAPWRTISKKDTSANWFKTL